MGVRLATGPAVWVLGAAGTASWGLLYYSFGVLLGPMAEALNVSETLVSGAFSTALLAAAVAAPVAGRAVDRRGAGSVMAFGSALGAAGFAIAGQANSAAWLYAAWALLGVAHACTSYEPAFAAVMAWVPEAHARRRALLVVTSLGGLASPLFVPLVAIVVAAVGFRAGAWCLAAALALIVTPLHAALATVRAPAASRQPAAPAVPTPAVLAVVLALHAFASSGLAAFAIPALVDQGLTPVEAAAMAGLAGGAQVAARLLYEPLCRWVPAPARLALLLTVQGAAFAGVGVLTGPALATALLAFGGANGLVTLERATVIAHWYGAAGYGARSGALAAGAMVARAAAPLTLGLLAAEASYARAFWTAACGLLAAGALQALGEFRRAHPTR